MSGFGFHSHRSAVYCRTGMVAASQPLAAASGLKVLANGGTAADAAVATAAALNVTEPTSTGIGGDCFALYYEAATKKVFALNGSGRAPQALTISRLAREGMALAVPPYHPYTITVPGACAGWCDLSARFGRLSMSQVLAPAILLAEDGFPVAPITSYFWGRGAQNQLARAVNGQELTIDGRAPADGEVFRNPGLARTLRQVAEGGKEAFYRGDIARAIADVIHEAGGCLTEADLAAHESTWEEPISVVFRGQRIWECPPNGQGLTALLALNILESFELETMPALSRERLHLCIEALRLAFADAFAFIADPQKVTVPVDELLSSAYAADRRQLINRQRAHPQITNGTPLASSGTVYFSVVDGEGNACSFINSNYMGFGTGIVPRGWGFSLQNRGHNFSLDPQHPNALAPGKRPYHTIIPAMATNALTGDLTASYGVMGGFMQPQGHVQVSLAMFVDGADPQTALDLPRFCIEPETGGRTEILLEEGIDLSTMAGLAEMGHRVTPVSGMRRAAFGRGQIIRRNPADGVLCGGSDPRADGCAAILV